MHSQKIDIIRKKYPHQWLLIAIDKIDESTTTPLTGRVIAHSKDRDEIYKKQMKCKGLIYLRYSEDGLPKGYAAAFYA